MQIFQRGRVAMWTKEKISTLTTPEVRQLHANAERLRETEIAARCDEVLGERPRGRAAVRRPRRKGEARRLVSRSKALGMRGVSLRNRFWSRGGVRASDGVVVMTLWADDVQRAGGASSYLLWAPNVDGADPENVFALRVEQRAQEYWATWGRLRPRFSRPDGWYRVAGWPIPLSRSGNTAACAWFTATSST